MVFGRGTGLGLGRGGGWGGGRGFGFGFRGASGPWPYIGRGRGGLPRCWYPYYPAYLPWDAAYGAPLTSATSLEALQNAALAIRDQISHIEARISEIEREKTA
jgi:hypothetical protein